jgi:hypothetical protein
VPKPRPWSLEDPDPLSGLLDRDPRSLAVATKQGVEAMGGVYLTQRDPTKGAVVVSWPDGAYTMQGRPFREDDCWDAVLVVRKHQRQQQGTDPTVTG